MGDKPYKHYPGLRSAGYAASLDLSNSVSVVTAAANGLDTFTVPAKMGTDKNGNAVYVGDISFALGSLGGGGSSGNWTLQVTRVSDGAAVGQGVITYNSATKTATLDCRDINGKGVPLIPGDSLRLDVMGVPVGLTTGGAGFKAHITAKQFGYDA